MDNFRINFPGYDELFDIGNLNEMPSKTPERNDSAFPYFVTRFNTKKLTSRNIDAENELSGRNYPLTRSGFEGFVPNSTQQFADDRPVIFDTPELLASAQNLRERKTCNTTSTSNLNIQRLNSLADGTYVPHPSVNYQPNSFLGQNSREVRRMEYHESSKYKNYNQLLKK